MKSEIWSYGNVWKRGESARARTRTHDCHAEKKNHSMDVQHTHHPSIHFNPRFYQSFFSRIQFGHSLCAVHSRVCCINNNSENQTTHIRTEKEEEEKTRNICWQRMSVARARLNRKSEEKKMCGWRKNDGAQHSAGMSRNWWKMHDVGRATKKQRT